MFGAGQAGQYSLSVPLPPGRCRVAKEGNAESLALWMSDEPAAPELWAQLLAAHPATGLWPLLLEPQYWEEDRPQREPRGFHPWETGELSPDRMTSPGDHDPATILADWWDCDGEDDSDGCYQHKPFGHDWPGLAGQSEQRADPGQAAAECARQILANHPRLRLGLVAADSGANALTLVGWEGPANHTLDTAEISAVVGSWERRFGVRVVAVGFDTLYLSVAAPPTSDDDARLLAAEHLAFCPDNFDSDVSITVEDYAVALTSTDTWTFWWD
ncbi:hypothetical protein BL253_29830 [Pseudofrankia asymbiotica]|uniref:DUF4253 domain-containing protein n=1 Tax=Pseudofrankia asymbiotica TaxID=1834516 RepID=A0A1V2I3C6_9ACTN|nr:hypothetical protein BL253_29830 [Pseudofrankia asymbiotica]